MKSYIVIRNLKELIIITQTSCGVAKDGCDWKKCLTTSLVFNWPASLRGNWNLLKWPESPLNAPLYVFVRSIQHCGAATWLNPPVCNDDDSNDDDDAHDKSQPLKL